MPLSKKMIIERKKAKQDFGDEIKRGIITLLERSENAFTGKEIADELSENYPPEKRSAVKAFVLTTELDFSERIKTYTEERNKYYYI